MIFDLHVHTNNSDGIFSPEKMVELAVERNLNGIAITDHDTINGVQSAINHSNNYDNFKVIPGIELSSVFNDEEVHILGYFIDYKDEKLIKLTNDLKKSRLTRGQKIVNNLNSLGFELSVEEVKKLSGEKYIGRPHIARVLVEKGYVADISEAFDKYLDRGRPAYAERYKMSIYETISLIKGVGGIPILAHPGLLKDKSIIEYCISLGISGLECIHSKHSNIDTDFLINIAKSKDLIITGGSDCHGDLINGDLLLGRYFVDINTIPKFKERI